MRGGRSAKAYSDCFVAFIWAMVLFRVPQWMMSCDGCLESERIALLQIKSFFNNPSTPVKERTIDSDDDCCNWVGVACSYPFIIGRVTMIRLLDYLNHPYRVDSTQQRFMNASLFLPFQRLTYLSLDGNRMVGCMENEGFEKLRALVNLEILSIRGNEFDNKVMSSLAKLSSLSSLDVSNNALEGTIDMNNIGFGAVTNMATLDLTGNNIRVLKGLEVLSNLTRLLISANNLVAIEGISDLTRLQSIELDNFSMSANNRNLLQNVTTISSLKVLIISNSRLRSQGWPSWGYLETLVIYSSILDDNFLETISIMMTNLTRLEIRNSSIDSTFPPVLCNLKRLEELYLLMNNLRGELPLCLSNLTVLRQISLYDNQLSGDISESALKNLSSLEMIDISYNQFRVPLSLAPFFNHSHLTVFKGEYNKEIYRDDGYYETNQQGIPLFLLAYLGLSSPIDDIGYVGSFPKFLYYQTNLNDVDMSNVKMKRDVGFPWWLIANNTNLANLFLHNCSLSGSLQPPITYHHLPTKLSYLDISDNEFFDSIPSHICAFFPRIRFLLLSNNQFFGKIPERLSNCSSLITLKARNNALSSEIPRVIWNMPQLTILDLSSNNFSGTLVLDFIYSLLQTVTLSRNKLGGTLSGGSDQHEISRVKKQYTYNQLRVLDLSHNNFMGTFPGWTVELPQLTHLLLNNNDFHGEVPTPLCLRQLKLIDVSHNRLSGRLSSALTSNYSNCNKSRSDGSHIIGVLEFWTKTNVYTYEGKPLQLMSGLDFSNNNFTGEIPPQIGHLEEIKVLNLSYNMLTGPIPSTFSDLTAIESLDLSHNNLSGVIPPQLTQLNSLSSFSVAYNNLSGKCPQNIAQFSTFNEDSYRGNPLLSNCTLPQPAPKPPIRPATNEDGNNDDEEDGGYIDMESFYGSSGVSFIMALLILASVLYINPNWRRVWFYYVGITVTTCYYFVVDHLPVPIRYKVLELRV